MPKSTTNIRRESAGWQVRMVRDGVEYSKYFRFTDGGIRQSFEKAKKWRDAKLRVVGERKWKKGPRKQAVNNSSGVTGVSKNVYGRWVATWHEKGKQHFRTFKFKKEAVAHRKAQELRLSQ
ncbi:MAG: hypothetical protein AAF497_01620 [Planctomycetota bacterium]